MPAKQVSCAGTRLGVHRKPVIGRNGRRALLDEGLSRIKTEIINVGIETDRARDAWVIKLFGDIRKRALIIFAGAEGLAPEWNARMAWDDRASIGLLGDVAPDGEHEKRVGVNPVLQP